MSFQFLALTVADVADVLAELSSRPDLQARVKREPVSMLNWVLDRDSRSWLFWIGGQLEFEGGSLLLRFRGEFFEFKVEDFGSRVAFYEPPKPTASTVTEVQSVFLEAIAVYGRTGQGPREPEPLEPFVPVFVDSYKELWKR